MDVFGISALALAEAAGVSLRTATRWKREGVPRSMRRAVAIGVHGDLGTLYPAWMGWKVWRDALWSPEGDAFTVAQVRAIPYRYEQLRALQLEVARLRAELSTRSQLPLFEESRGLAMGRLHRQNEDA